MHEYFDICVNLLNTQFNKDRDAVLSRAASCGVTRMMITATDIQTSRAAQAWCTADNLFCTAGVHPHDIGSVSDDWLDQLRTLAGAPAVRAIGETGLDFNRNFSPRDAQLQGFEAQIELACSLHKPLFVHDRDSQGEVLKCLQKFQAGLPPVVVHCFTGTEDELKGYLEQDFYIGITGWVADQRRGAELREIVGQIPLARLLIETDAPFLKPHNVPADFLLQMGLDAASNKNAKRRNEPAMLPFVAAAIAAHRPESEAEIAAASTANARRFFGF
ncbi:MAG: TatD family hydrolase [Pseudomonadota bacterium]